MKLYMVPLAPTPGTVLLYIAAREALGESFMIEPVIVNTLKGKHKAPEHLARNPFGTLPVLEWTDNQFILESRVIIDFLEDTFPTHRLFSTDPIVRAQQRDIERICDVRLGDLMAHWVHAYKSPLGLEPDPTRAAELEQRMQGALNYLNSLLSDERPFLCGNAPCPADCTLAAFLHFMRFTDRNLIEEYAHLVTWDASYRARAVVQQVLNP